MEKKKVEMGKNRRKCLHFMWILSTFCSKISTTLYSANLSRGTSVSSITSKGDCKGLFGASVSFMLSFSFDKRFFFSQTLFVNVAQ